MNLKTVAIYNSPTQAHMARSALQAEGIRAFIADAELVAMDLLLSSAVGGVKVQVEEGDAEKAAEVLTDVYGDAGGVVTGQVDLDELERQALAATPAEEEEPPAPVVAENQPADVAAPIADERTAYAKRFVRASVFSFLIPPMAFYAIYLMLNAVFGSGRLTINGWLNLVVGGLLLISMLAILSIWMEWYGIDFMAFPL